MLFDTPFRLGPFTVDTAGGMIPPGDRPARFQVNWRGCMVAASLRCDPAAEVARLELSAVIGQVPSSASDGGPRREDALALLRGMIAAPAAGISVGLSADHRVMLQAERRIEVPVTASRLIAEVTDFVLAAAPYLDLTGESGAMAPAGSANT